MLAEHSSIFWIVYWNWKHLINLKAQAKKVFWHMILHSYLCNDLYICFSSKSKATNVFLQHILKSKAWDQSIQAKTKLFYLVAVRNYLWKFLIKIESMWRCKVKEQAPQLALLHCSRTVRSSHQRCSLKKALLKNFAIFTCVGLSF